MNEQLFDKAPIGYFSFYDDGALFHVNETLASMLQYDKPQLEGKNVETIFTLPARIFFQTHFFPLIKIQGHAEELFIHLLTSDGTHLPVLVNANRAEWDGRALTSCACIVVPTRKKFEDELIAARNAAELALRENTELLKVKEELQSRTEKLEEQMQLVSTQHHELQQFSHAVTHSLKEPLRKMLMYADRLQSESQLRGVHKLATAAAQMRAVVTALQEYVWLDEKADQFTMVDLGVVAAKAAEKVQKEFGADMLTLAVAELPSLEGDAEQLQLLLYHLLSNAVKFRKHEKALVTINATVLSQNKFRSVKRKYQYKDFVRLEVRDEGVGFDPAYKVKVFELFKKLHVSQGPGLGLALCKKIAANHGGYIEAESSVGEFTKITTWLPLKQL